MSLTDRQKDLSIMHWLPKMHKTPIGCCHFIVVSKQCSTKPLTKTISDIFNMIYSHKERSHNKCIFSNLKHFWIFQNTFPIDEKLARSWPTTFSTTKSEKCCLPFNKKIAFTQLVILCLNKTLVFQREQTVLHFGQFAFVFLLIEVC